jgi:hypothetical protein
MLGGSCAEDCKVIPLYVVVWFAGTDYTSTEGREPPPPGPRRRANPSTLLLQTPSPPLSLAAAAGMDRRAFPAWCWRRWDGLFPCAWRVARGRLKATVQFGRRRSVSADWLPRAGVPRCGGAGVVCGAAWWCWWLAAPARPRSGPIWAPSRSGRADWSPCGGKAPWRWRTSDGGASGGGVPASLLHCGDRGFTSLSRPGRASRCLV